MGNLAVETSGFVTERNQATVSDLALFTRIIIHAILNAAGPKL
jgi:hypothetical protein